MAKDLPYFKFFCSEWNDGDITLEDYEVQGLFINLCSYYWSNECNLKFNKAEKKFKDAPVDLWQTLLDSEIIKEVDSNLVITFLDEQREERLERSKIRSKGGKASAEARRLKKLQQNINTSPTKNQHVLNSCSTQSQLLRREEKRRYNIYTPENFLENWKQMHKGETSIKQLSLNDKEKFKALNKTYSKEDFHNALKGMFNQEKILPSCLSSPQHFLDENQFIKYLDAQKNKKYNLYK